MVNILAFPGKPSAKTSQQDSLDRDATIPLVASTMDGTLVVARDAGTQGPSGDWINQELADLYRVEALLVQAGIRISTGRGLTDENEPWFVFCRNDGEVFVHLARIKGVYLLDSPGLGTLLEGSDFASLIDRFVKQVAARNAPESNVVRFRPQMLHDRTVRLHPAVMLAALVWTLYLASDDLVGTAEAADSLATDGGFIPHDIMDMGKDDAAFGPDMDLADGILPTPDGHIAPQIVSLHAAGPGDRHLAGSQENLRSQQNVDGRSLSAALPAPVFSAHAITASLAVIAFGYGFSGTHSFTDLASIATDKAVAVLHYIVDQNTDAKPSPIPEQADGSPIDLAVNTPHNIAAHDVATEFALQDQALDYALLAVGVEEVHGLVAESEKPEAPIVQADEQVSTEGAGQSVPVATVAKTPPATQAAESQDNTVVTVVTATKPLSDTQNLISLVTEHSGPVLQYLVEGVAVSATLEQDDLDKVMFQINEVENTAAEDAPPASTPTTPTAEQQGKPITGSIFASYDDQAKKFVNEFILEAGSIEMVQIQNDLMLVDMTAIDEPIDHAFVRSWLTDDGHVISTVGHYQVFMDYGFV